MRKLLVGVAVLMCVVGSAMAGTKTIQDPKGDNTSDDPPDQGDIRSVTSGHTPSGKLKFKIVQWNSIEGTDRPRTAPSVVIVTEHANTDCASSSGMPISFGGEDEDDQLSSCGEDYGYYRTTNPNKYTRVFIVAKKWLADVGDPVPAKFFWGVKTVGDVAPDSSSWFSDYWHQNVVRHRL